MAVNRDPILKRCRSLQIDPSHLGIFKESKRNTQRNNRKMSEYDELQNDDKKTYRSVFCGCLMHIAALALGANTKHGRDVRYFGKAVQKYI